VAHATALMKGQTDTKIVQNSGTTYSPWLSS